MVQKSLEKIASFEALQTLRVTGAVFTPPLFEWTQMVFGKDVHLISTLGGTDICSSCRLFVLSYFLTSSNTFVVVTGTPNLPAYAGGRFTTNLPSLGLIPMR